MKDSLNLFRDVAGSTFIVLYFGMSQAKPLGFFLFSRTSDVSLFILHGVFVNTFFETNSFLPTTLVLDFPRV